MHPLARRLDRPQVLGLPEDVDEALRLPARPAHLAGRATLLSADKAEEYLAPAWTCRGNALTRDTGWRAEIDLELGLHRTAVLYQKMGWL